MVSVEHSYVQWISNIGRSRTTAGSYDALLMVINPRSQSTNHTPIQIILRRLRSTQQPDLHPSNKPTHQLTHPQRAQQPLSTDLLHNASAETTRPRVKRVNGEYGR